MSGMTSKLTVISVSDVHLGHRKTPTKHILDNLRRQFPNSESMRDVDLICIVGDLFDGPLGYYSEDAVEIQLWLNDFLNMCAEKNIILRVLEGTRSHDWKQSIWSTVVKVIGKIPIDLKWVSELSIERIESLGIDVLYVPDEWRPECDQTWMEVRQLLAAHSIEQVDFTFLHGAFDRQMPEFVDCPKHNADRYAEITRRHVFAGHIHKPWVYRNIRGNGSFDRLAHGEEEPKGYWKVSYGPGGASKEQFIENKHAMVYRTIACDGMSVEQALAKIEKATAKLPEQSHVRIQALAHDAILQSLDLLKKNYKQFHWSTKTSDSKVSQAKLLVDHRPVSKHVPITPENIAQLLLERLSIQGVDPDLLQHCSAQLSESGFQVQAMR